MASVATADLPTHITLNRRSALVDAVWSIRTITRCCMFALSTRMEAAYGSHLPPECQGPRKRSRL